MTLDEAVTISTIPSPVNQTEATGIIQRVRWERRTSGPQPRYSNHDARDHHVPSKRRR